jgi:DNA-binding response OmpR family regulator
MNTILIVDDEEAIRTIFSSVLRQKGYHVLQAEAGLDGYEMAKKHLPDLIITDVAMAGGGGEALLHFIRNDPDLCNKQVVMITGNTDAVSQRQGMEAGADDFLTKPVALEALIGCVEARLRRAQLNSQNALVKLTRKHEEIEKFILSAQKEMETPSFRAWERSEYATLAIVFTDIVGFTRLCQELKDDGIKQVRQQHFSRSRELIKRYEGCEIKTMGDSFLAAFRSTRAAFRFAQELQKETGHPLVRIRAGIHIGPMHVEENDVFGGTVNFAGRIISSIKESEIRLSDEAKTDIERLGGKFAQINWQKHDDVHFKGFPGTWTLWSVRAEEDIA